MVSKSNQEKGAHGYTRRSFISGAGMGLAGMALVGLTGCAPKSSDQTEEGLPTSWDKEADVVIVGCGGCGAPAALSAAEAGASVICVEAAAMIGGSAALCAGTIVAADTKYQRDAGVSDSPEQYLEDVKKFIGDATIQRAGDDWNLFLMQANEGGATIDWLADHGVEFNAPVAYPGHSVDRLHVLTPNSGAWTQVVKQKLDDLGVDLMLSTPADSLVVDETGAVVGIKTSSGSRSLFIKANKGVLIAAGGFDANPDIKLKYYDETFANIAYANSFNDGSGVIMAQKIGADLTDLTAPVSNLMRTTQPGPDAGITQKQKWMKFSIINAGAILVNKEGRRFCDEEQSDSDLIPLSESQTDKQCWMVYDEAVAANFRDFPQSVVSSLAGKGWGTVEDFIEHGGIKVAETIEEVAELVGVDPAGLADQIATWNAACSSGSDDEFERSTFGREEAGTLGQGLVKPPFYIHGPIRAECNQGWASLAITENFEVKDVTGEVIPGLYCGGQMGHGLSPIAGGGHGGTMCWALTSGRLAGAHIASL